MGEKITVFAVQNASKNSMHWKKVLSDSKEA
jgi:hypothetical protein